MEQIYTIPVNEAFEAVGDGKECACPFCVLYKKLQNDEIDIILGASMMEPDIRMRTNELGFCDSHYAMMLKRKRMLGMGLMMESHLAEVEKSLDGRTVLGNKAQASISDLLKLEESCYVCSRIDKNLSAMIATAVYLYESDEQFLKRFQKVPFFCLPHYRKMLDYASKKMSKKSFRSIHSQAYAINKKYITELQGDVSWFCKKFDYRYDEEPWYNSKDSVQRSIKFLTSDFGRDD